MRVYKYTLDAWVTTLSLPAGAQVLHVAFQREECCLWVLINPRVDLMVGREFLLMETGRHYDVSGTLIHISTLNRDNYREVYHAFEIIT